MTHPQPHLHKRWLWVGISLYSLKKVIGAIKLPTTQGKKPQGKPLAMSFKPASAKDEEIIVNALPKPDDLSQNQGEIDPSKIPTSFSSGLKMSAEIYNTPQSLDQKLKKTRTLLVN